MATLTDGNPYVGPRTFTTAERKKFYGRDREARDLTALIISNRVVLFYAPSGAGKSSLLNTMVRPALAAEGFEVLPTGRVSGFSGEEVEAENIYVFNLLLSLHQREETPSHFETMTLPAFLDTLVRGEDGRYHCAPDYVYPATAEFRPRVLIIDQLEELLTTNAARWQQRAGFFEQLAQALAADDQLWVVLTMREDFVARLDPYLHLLPNRLRYRYYMERLAREAALEAIRRPAAAAGRPFVEEGAQWLVDNLRRIRGSGDGEERLDQFVEPVQLQAVCYQMWEKLAERPGQEITLADVRRYADVDTALTNFYEETIARTVAETGVAETELRSWFGEELLTEAGTRNMVFRGEEMTGSLPTPVADYVRGQFILREVVRPGGTWYELVHDRFVAPIVAANQAWRQEQPLIRLAQEWDEAGRPADLLLSGQRLEKLDAGAGRALGLLVAEFVAAGQAQAQADEEAQRRRELEQQRALASEASARREAEAERAREAEMRAREAEVAAARLRQRRNLAFGLAGMAVLLAVASFYLLVVARRSADMAAMQEARAVEEATRALAAESVAVAEATRAATNLVAAQTAEADARESAALAATRAAEAQYARLETEAQATVAAENSAQAISQAQTRVASAGEWATAVSVADQVLATQEAFLITNQYSSQVAEIQSVRDTLAGVSSQNLQVGMNVDPRIYLGDFARVEPAVTQEGGLGQLQVAPGRSVLTPAPEVEQGPSERLPGAPRRATSTPFARTERVAPQQVQPDILPTIAFMPVAPERLLVPETEQMGATEEESYGAGEMAGLDWVRLPFRVDPAADLGDPADLEAAVARYDPVIQAYALRGISVLFILNQETFRGNVPGARGDWEQYAARMAGDANRLAGEMSERYARYGSLIAYEIWNEPDINSAVVPTASGVPPAAYAVILAETVAAIRSASPEAKIIFGSLAGSPEQGVAYLQAVQESLGGRLPVDAIGLKPYGRYGTFDPFWNEQFGSLGALLSVYGAAYPDTPLWITEIGVASDAPVEEAFYPTIAAYMRDVYSYIGTGYAQQVPVVIWYAWSDYQNNAGVVDLAGEPKAEIYDAFIEIRDGELYAAESP